ncbi:hypothetical protein VaNZ11_000802 [Volvox africanus]|uniref:RDRP core domain-containing protein n=1 Tax=Volvox africanus TaxID=51714 RepID=A0ABQ5RN45_9CHLO|nr:hypothetical protein VaNZ11_000802 [Volvox africanus]
MASDHADIAGFPSNHHLLAESLTDWDVLSAVSKSSWEEAIVLLSRRLGCLPDVVHALQLTEKLHLYLHLPLPLRLLLHQHCIALSALPLPRLVDLLNSPPQQLAAALDAVANPYRNPVDCIGNTGWKRRWRPTVEFMSAASAVPVDLNPGEALLLFLSSGWLSYEPGRRGLTGQQPSQPASSGPPVDTLGVPLLPGAELDATAVLEAAAAEPSVNLIALPGQCGGTGVHPGGECRYIWHPEQGNFSPAHECDDPQRAEQHWRLQHQHWLQHRQVSGGLHRTGPLAATEATTRLSSCRTLTAVMEPPPAVGEAPGCAGWPRLARLEYNMYDFPASHLQRHPLIGSSLDRLLFVRFTADMLPQQRQGSYAAPRSRPRPSLHWKYGNSSVAASSTAGKVEVTDPCVDGGWGSTALGARGSADINPLAVLLTDGVVVAGRRYRRLVVKDAGKTGEKICFFAQDTLSFDDVRHGFRSLGPPSAIRQLLADVSMAAEAARRAVAAPTTQVAGVGDAAAAGIRVVAGNEDAMAMTTGNLAASTAAAAKAASRSELFLSGTWPLAIHPASICYTEDVVSSSGAVMTDGNGLICARLARMIPYTYQGAPLVQLPLPYSSSSPARSAANPWDAYPGSVGSSNRQLEVARQVVMPASVHAAAQEASTVTAAGGRKAGPLAMTAAGPVLEPPVQLRMYDSRFSVIVKGTFTPVVSGLPPGVSLLVRASQVKAPSWKKLQMLLTMSRITPGHPASSPGIFVPGYSHPGSLEPAGASTSSTYGEQSSYSRLGSSATDATLLQFLKPAALTIKPGKTVAGYAARNHLGTEKGSQMLLLAPRRQPAGATTAVVKAAAAATAEMGNAVLEVVRKAPARPGAVARLNGPLLLLLSVCCIDARTLMDILKEELGKVLAAQRGDLKAARELATRGGRCNSDDDALLDGLRSAGNDADASTAADASAAARTTTTLQPHDLPCSTAGVSAESGGGGLWCAQSRQRNVSETHHHHHQQQQQGQGQQRRAREEELRGGGGTELQRLGLDYRTRELLQACATRAWRQLWELRLPLLRSASIMGLPDPSASIPEGCVVLLPELESESGLGQRLGSSVDGSLDSSRREGGTRVERQLEREREVVVYRFPGLHPRDLRKFRVIAPPPQLLSQLGLTPTGTSSSPSDSPESCSQTAFEGGGGAGGGNRSGRRFGGGNILERGGGGEGGRLLFFSTSGSQAPVYGMSGGDYDGDQYTVIWDERVVERFEAYPDEAESGTGGRDGQRLAASSRNARCKGESDCSSADDEARWEPFQAQRVLLEPPISARVAKTQATDTAIGAVTGVRDCEVEDAAAEEEEEEYLTRRYLFCHEAANVVTEAYRLWIWCADEYGADHPYSLMLCRLYSEALDAPKTGAFRRIPFNLRDKVRPPHWAPGPGAPSPSESHIASGSTLPASGAAIQPREESAIQVKKGAASSTDAGLNASGPRNSAAATAVAVTVPVTGRDRRRRQELIRTDAQRPSGPCDPWGSDGPSGALTWTTSSADDSVDVGSSGADEGAGGEAGPFVSPW